MNTSSCTGSLRIDNTPDPKRRELRRKIERFLLPSRTDTTRLLSHTVIGGLFRRGESRGRDAVRWHGTMGVRLIEAELRRGLIRHVICIRARATSPKSRRTMRDVGWCAVAYQPDDGILRGTTTDNA